MVGSGRGLVADRATRFRAGRVRWEKKAENRVAAVDLACAYYTLKRIAVLGMALILNQHPRPIRWIRAGSQAITSSTLKKARTGGRTLFGLAPMMGCSLSRQGNGCWIQSSSRVLPQRD